MNSLFNHSNDSSETRNQPYLEIPKEPAAESFQILTSANVRDASAEDPCKSKTTTPREDP